MIRKLTGRVTHKTELDIVLDVNGVGYLVTVPNPTNFSLEEETSLWTYLAVRENALDMYGFSTLDELDIFNALISLPKIGPKSAAQILAQADILLLKQAVAENDPSYLAKMSGIGKKSAENIVRGLQGKLDHLDFVSKEGTSTTKAFQSETIDALVALGYSHKDAREAVGSLPPNIQETSTALKEALRNLSS